jgi:hypothetical protein
MASPPITGPSNPNTPGTNQINVLNAVVPPEGPKALPLVLDFTSVASILVDLTITTAQGKISTVQMIWADNSTNAALLTIAVSPGTQQTIKVPPGAQGWFPVMATNRPKLTFSTTAGAGQITVILLNVPVAQGQWFPSGSNERNVALAPLATSITNGGTAVAVFAEVSGASVVPSDGAVIVNPWSASESLFVDIVNNAGTVAPGSNGTTVELKAGASFPVPANFKGTVTANAVTSGHTFSAYGVGHN